MEIRNFAIIAHVDHGKSTLADRLLEVTGTVTLGKHEPQLLDRNPISRERGITIKLAPVTMRYSLGPLLHLGGEDPDPHPRGVPAGEYLLNLIDTPGHVDFSYEVSRSLAAVEGAILLVDASQGIQAQTLAHLEVAKQLGLTVIGAINKVDLPDIALEPTIAAVAELVGVSPDEVIKVSGKTGSGVEELLSAIIEKIPQPAGTTPGVKGSHTPGVKEAGMTRALIFDSFYDEHRGVIAAIRVVDGSFEKSQLIHSLATKAKFKIIEVGQFRPDLTPTDQLAAGEIGYVVSGLKDIRLVRVGDTLGEASARPLAGYEPARQYVFAGVFPTDQGEYERLRSSLEKLQLEDAAISLEVESHPALGRGLRVGALGLLHLDIIRQRLEREYSLSTIVATPQVEVKRSADGFEEPWVEFEIVTPPAYASAIYLLLKEDRAEVREERSLGDRTLLIGLAPLMELIVDFYDQLKSRSQGYASVNWEFREFRPAELVELDILLNNDVEPALRQLLHRTKVERRARALVSKLETLIPRQLVEVRIQAAIQGKIIASGRISALRKDVIAKLYGGDYTRKSKLLKKQAAGKKKMFARSKVTLPPDVYLKAFQG